MTADDLLAADFAGEAALAGDKIACPTDQNRNFSPNWICLDVPTIEVICPALDRFPVIPAGDPVSPPTAVNALSPGIPKLAWLKILKISARN